MKRSLIMILMFIFIFIFAINTWAADIAYTPYDFYSSLDTWYTIEPKKPFLEFFYISRDEYPDINIDQRTQLGFKYFQNDHFFFDYTSTGEDKSSTYLAGSYLFRNGIFIEGIYDDQDPVSKTIISPGYRFKFGTKNYLAFRIEYLSTSGAESNTSEINAFDLTFKYFGKKSKFIGEIYSPSDADMIIFIDTAFKVNKKMTLGVCYKTIEDEVANNLGFTWENDKLIIDMQIGKEQYDTDSPLDNYYKCGGMYKIGTKFMLGADILKYSLIDDSQASFKAKYLFTKSKMALKYDLKNDTYPSVVNLIYQRSL